MKQKTAKFLFLLFFLLPLPFLAAEEINGIAAAVDNEIITTAELNEQFQFLLMSGFLKPKDSLQIDSLKTDLLTQIIDKKILIKYAQEESIEVTDEEIQERLDLALEDVRSRFPDEETFIQQLQNEGLNLKTFEENYKKQIRENFLLQKLMQKEFGAEMFVTEREIEKFYETNKDSFAEPEKIELAHILIIPKPSETEEKRLETKINEVFLRLQFNEDFAEIAKKYSEGKFRYKGGDLGFVSKDDLPPEIADVAFSIKKDSLTLARGREGFYLLKYIGKRDGKRHLKSIFFKTRITNNDTLNARKIILQLKKKAESGEDFAKLAGKYSDDIETKIKSGLLGEVYIEQLHPLFRNAVKNLQTGEVSEPVKTEFGFHIFKVLSKPGPAIPELEEVKNIVREFIIQKRTAEKTDELLKRILSNFYVKIFLK